jgi:hypothetical protein
MPSKNVMKKWKAGTLKSGGSGKKVTSQKQAVAIKLSEERNERAHGGEYQEAYEKRHPK